MNISRSCGGLYSIYAWRCLLNNINKLVRSWNDYDCCTEVVSFIHPLHSQFMNTPLVTKRITEFAKATFYYRVWSDITSMVRPLELSAPAGLE